MSKLIEELIKFKRSDKIYKEVENFRDYELTTGLIYEMYIRTKPVKIRKYETDEFFIKFKESLVFYFEHKVSDVVLYEYQNQKFTLDNIIYTIFPQLYNEVLNKVDNDQTKVANYEIRLKDLISNYIENNDPKIIFNEIIFKDISKNCYIKMTKDKLKEYISRINVQNTVIPNYSRPQLYTQNNYFVTIHQLNLSLPKKDLISFIIKLKENIWMKDKELVLINPNNYIKREKTSKLERLEIKNKGIFNNPLKMADLFFVYDVMSLGKDKNISQNNRISYIIGEILNNRTEAKAISNRTILNYYYDAKVLIDEYGFEFLF